MNEQINKIRFTAERTLKILDLIEQGLKAGEIVQKTGANRQLVDYYLRASNPTPAPSKVSGLRAEKA